VLDEIIPPSADGRLPGAGALGMAGAVENFLQRTPGAVSGLARALEALGAEGFGALAGAQRTQALHDFEAKTPGFVPSLIAPTYLSYYQEPRVVTALGLSRGRPTQRGMCRAGDLSGLEAVRRRGRSIGN
jgi:hypothetical protein